jgi:hypothetical protein
MSDQFVAGDGSRGNSLAISRWRDSGSKIIVHRSSLGYVYLVNKSMVANCAVSEEIGG